MKSRMALIGFMVLLTAVLQAPARESNKAFSAGSGFSYFKGLQVNGQAFLTQDLSAGLFVAKYGALNLFENNTSAGLTAGYLLNNPVKHAWQIKTQFYYVDKPQHLFISAGVGYNYFSTDDVSIYLNIHYSKDVNGDFDGILADFEAGWTWYFNR